MKHAGREALKSLTSLMEKLRAFPEIRERSHGTFYRAGKAFLHFHEDGAALYADVRLDMKFERIRVTAAQEQAKLLKVIVAALRREKISKSVKGSRESPSRR